MSAWVINNWATVAPSSSDYNTTTAHDPLRFPWQNSRPIHLHTSDWNPALILAPVWLLLHFSRTSTFLVKMSETKRSLNLLTAAYAGLKVQEGSGRVISGCLDPPPPPPLWKKLTGFLRFAWTPLGGVLGRSPLKLKPFCVWKHDFLLSVMREILCVRSHFSDITSTLGELMFAVFREACAGLAPAVLLPWQPTLPSVSPVRQTREARRPVRRQYVDSAFESLYIRRYK